MQQNNTEERTPNQIIFAVTEEISELLRTAEYINDAEIILVPTNVSYRYETDQIVTDITSTEIKEYIENNRR